jgi:hypothetical protein
MRKPILEALNASKWWRPPTSITMSFHRPAVMRNRPASRPEFEPYRRQALRRLHVRQIAYWSVVFLVVAGCLAGLWRLLR